MSTQTRMPGRWTLGLAAASIALFTLALHGQQPQQPAPQQPADVAVVISGEPGTPPRYAVPDFVALSPDASDIAKTIGQVLWDDLNYEREFYMIPRDTYSTIPVARSGDQVPFAAWRELGADAVVFGTVQQTGNMVRVQVRLFNVRTRQSVYAKEFSGSASNPRLYAHTVSDEVLLQQRGVHGVARTKLAFSSDRDRGKVAGTVENRTVKEIYIADYDGANQRRITAGRELNIDPAWSPDGRALAYTSFRRGAPNIFASRIFDGVLDTLTKSGNDYLPVYSPDGTRIAFMSARDGNAEIYVMNADGSNQRRLTNHPADDTTPTWSPSGAQIAFTSDRSGTPQIYIMGADGSNLRRITTSDSYADRATWSPAPYNEIAYAGRTGPGFDIKVYDVASGETRQLTFGSGSNESPVYSPNGKHIAFTSTRGSGLVQIWTMTRDGRDLRQVTKAGNNYTPSWSK